MIEKLKQEFVHKDKLMQFIVDKGHNRLAEKINEIIDAVNDLDRSNDNSLNSEKTEIPLEWYKEHIDWIRRERLVGKPAFVNTCDSCANAKLGLYKMCYACRSYDHYRMAPE